MRMLYQIYFFVSAIGAVWTCKRLVRLYTENRYRYGRFLPSTQVMETLFALGLFVCHFYRCCDLLAHGISPGDFRVMWIVETFFFGNYLRGIYDEKHYYAIEKALHAAFPADD